MPEPLLLLHGFTHTGASWRPVIDAFASPGDVLAPDLRGHGARSDTRPVDLAGCLEDIAAIGPDRFALAGYSMGGRIALHAALAMPSRISRLTLVGASPGIEDAADRAERRDADETLADELERDGLEAFATRWAENPVLADQPPEIRAAVHADRMRNTAAGLAAALRGLSPGVVPPVWDRLPELTMPVTLIVGERDARYRALAEQMLPALRHATLTVVPGAGHAVHLEAPAAVAAAL